MGKRNRRYRRFKQLFKNRFVYGPRRSGKTTYLVSQVVEAIKDEAVFVFAPNTMMQRVIKTEIETELIKQYGSAYSIKRVNFLTTRDFTYHAVKTIQHKIFVDEINLVMSGISNAEADNILKLNKITLATFTPEPGARVDEFIYRMQGTQLLRDIEVISLGKARSETSRQSLREYSMGHTIIDEYESVFAPRADRWVTTTHDSDGALTPEILESAFEALRLQHGRAERPEVVRYVHPGTYAALMAAATSSAIN